MSRIIKKLNSIIDPQEPLYEKYAKRLEKVVSRKYPFWYKKLRYEKTINKLYSNFADREVIEKIREHLIKKWLEHEKQKNYVSARVISYLYDIAYSYENVYEIIRAANKVRLDAEGYKLIREMHERHPEISSKILGKKI